MERANRCRLARSYPFVSAIETARGYCDLLTDGLTTGMLSTGSVHSNIAYGREQTTREEVEEAAKMANCDFIWDLPQGFDTQSQFDRNDTSDSII